MPENSHRNILNRLRAGEPVHPGDKGYEEINRIVARTLALSAKLNSTGDTDLIRSILSEITGTQIDRGTTVFPPFYTNFGGFISIGKNVFINHACSFLDMGGITIEDNVLIGPKVNLITENHPIDPAERRSLVCKPILIRENAWIGAAATILPGVTIGRNAIVAAGAVVSKDVDDNTIVGGIPAKVLKTIDSE
jgi:acetyltransferase-like isoleucine patch superfamily enzyme